jgi:toxin ParE1/3/4
MAFVAIFHRLAAKEYRAARDWYAVRSRAVSSRFVIAVDEAVTRIEASPDALATLAGPYRYARVRGFPYACVFRVRPDSTILIVAVAHARRRPAYWRRRA